MSRADELTFWLAVFFVMLCMWSTWLASELRRERAAHRETKLHFRRVAVADWAKRMPRAAHEELLAEMNRMLSAKLLADAEPTDGRTSSEGEERE